jgi:hypothetical protein
MSSDEPIDAELLPGPRTMDTKVREHRRAHIPPYEAQGRAWLSWKSNGCDHGLKLHKVGLDGVVQEARDSACPAATRKKPNAVSLRQRSGC